MFRWFGGVLGAGKRVGLGGMMGTLKSSNIPDLIESTLKELGRLKFADLVSEMEATRQVYLILSPLGHRWGSRKVCLRCCLQRLTIWNLPTAERKCVPDAVYKAVKREPLFRHLKAKPKDRVLRGVFADWLEEHGYVDWARRERMICCARSATKAQQG